MPEFIAMIWEQRDSRPEPTSPDFMAFMEGYTQFGEIAGHAIRGGNALLGDETATTIHVEGGRDGDVVAHDGPYAETKEFLGGYYVLEAEDIDAAVALARHIPAAWRDGGRVEVRPTMPM